MKAQHEVLLRGHWVPVPKLLHRIYERFAYRLLGYSASSTRYDNGVEVFGAGKWPK